MRARRSRSRRIWPRPTSHWRSSSELATLDFTQASEEYERALALAPGNAEVLRHQRHICRQHGALRCGHCGRTAAPSCSTRSLATAIWCSAGRCMRPAAIRRRLRLSQKSSVLIPTSRRPTRSAGLPIYGLGDLQSARASCETKPDDWGSQQCLAVVYDKLGRHADAEAELAKMKARNGRCRRYQYATIYAQWGDRSKALEWLETAMRLRDPGLEFLKTDPLLDPLRKEPRFQAMSGS